MNFLIRFLSLCLTVGSALAQSSLPPCQGGDISRWINCFGTHTYSNAYRYVGEWKDGRSNGKGSLYAPDGFLMREGIWANNNLVKSTQIISEMSVSIDLLSTDSQKIEIPNKFPRELFLVRMGNH
jgi:hypothetical protein